MAGLGGVIGTVLGWLGYHVGLRTDAASATGSLHAKVSDVKDTLTGTISGKIFPWHQKVATFSKGSISQIEGSTTMDILSVVGNRVVLDGAFVGSAPGGDAKIQLRLEIDGVEIFPWISVSLSVTNSLFSSDVTRGIGKIPLLRSLNDNGIAGSTFFYFPIPHGLHFSSSIKFQIRNTASYNQSDMELGAFLWHVPA